MSKYAYVTTLYGDNIYITGALVVAHTLRRVNTKNDLIILVTPDVPQKSIDILSKIYTKVIPVDYLEADSSYYMEDTRFRGVFTKLRAFELIDYEKVIILDLDMIVT